MSYAHPDIATTLLSTAHPKHIHANITYIDEPID
jgi:hypothetical protein